MTETTAAEAPKETPKQASAPVIAQHAATLKALPFSDTRDFDDAKRGFLGTIENARITNPQGRVVWSLEPYGFLAAEEAPPTVDPSLWRQSRLNMNHGLFEVVPGVYQVRGLDIANMTLIEGDKRRDRGGHADLDRGCPRRDGIVLPAPRQAPGRRRDLHPHPYRPLGRRARRARRRDACERNGADHRAEFLHGARGFGKHHRGPRDAAARAISVRAAARQGRARAGRLRPRQVDGGGLGGAAAPDRSDHRNRRQARHRRPRIRIPDGAELGGAGGDAFLHPALQASESGGKLHA